MEDIFRKPSKKFSNLVAVQSENITRSLQSPISPLESTYSLENQTFQNEAKRISKKSQPGPLRTGRKCRDIPVLIFFGIVTLGVITVGICSYYLSNFSRYVHSYILELALKC